MRKKINLAVIFGGQSGEHEVSLSSAKAVLGALNQEKYTLIPIAITKKGHWLIGEKGSEYLKRSERALGKEGALDEADWQDLLELGIEGQIFFGWTEGNFSQSGIDLVLPLVHGPFGEDGRLQGLLDMLGIPYVFSGVLAQAIGMNKAKAKILAKNFRVAVVRDMVITKKNIDVDRIIESLGLPLVLKPAELGSSVGVSIAKNRIELERGVTQALCYGKEAIAEQYIKGRELTVTVMGNENPRVLAITEIIPLISEFYDYKAKYETGGSRHICPAEIPVDFQQKLEEYAIKTFQAIGCADLARIDFMCAENEREAYFIDINTIPGMTPTSLAPEAAKQFGLDFSTFLDELIDGAMERYRIDSRRINC